MEGKGGEGGRVGNLTGELFLPSESSLRSFS